MMEPDYFDEDDMIADYMEDMANELPPEAYMDEEDLLPQDESGAVATTDNNGNNNTIANPVTFEPTTNNNEGNLDFQTAFGGIISNTSNDASAASNSDRPTTTAAVVTPANEIRHEYSQNQQQVSSDNNNNSKKKNRDKDLYSFQRYHQGLAWRDTTTKDKENNKNQRHKDRKPSEFNTMEATNWKSSSNKNFPSKRSSSNSSAQTGSSPDAQLLDYYHCRHSGKRLSKQQQQMTTNQQRQQRIVIKTSNSIRLNPKEGEDSIPLTLGNGTRVYLTKKSSTKTTSATIPNIENNNDANSKSKVGNNKLLGTSMSELMRRVQSSRRKAEHEKLRNSRKTSSSNSSSLPTEEEATNESSNDDSSPTKYHNDTQNNRNNTNEDKLWVDKHAPSSFTSLLSDERTNREVIRALREWDSFVFHRDPPKRVYQSQKQQQQQQQDNNGEKQDNNGGTNKNPKDRRPDANRRVILLSGPPGVGKTTLAHIAAKHVGYRPLEINASDERSTSVLKDRVLRTMESNTLQFAHANNEDYNKPNCLILDEIDGADAKGAIEALVEIIRTEMPTAKQKNKSKKTYLTRPIIFICNNKYAPALRPLLPYSIHFNVAPPMTNRLVARLNAVLCAEKVSLSSTSSIAGVLHQLVNASGGDIRSCLFTLQIAATSALGQKQNGRADISNALLSSIQGGKGKKDDRMDIMGVVQKIFCKDKKKDNIFGNNNKSRLLSQIVSKRHTSRNVQTVLDAVENFGDYSKVLDCLFLNLNRVPYIDPTMEKCSISLEWLSGVDIYRSGGTSEFLYSFQRYYMPISAGAIHSMCCVDNIPTHLNSSSYNNNLIYSTRILSDMQYQYDANAGILSKFSDGLSPKIRTSRKYSTLAADTIPYTLWVLSAGDGVGNLNRPASSFEILTALEQMNFTIHTTKLRALGLIYAAKDASNITVDDEKKQQQQQQPEIRLEPPIDQLVQFPHLKVSPHQERKEIPFVMKGLLAQKTAHDRLCHTATSNNDNDTVPTTKKATAFSTKDEKKKDSNSIATIASPVDGKHNDSTATKRKGSDDDPEQKEDARPSKISKKTIGDGTTVGCKKAEAASLAPKNFLGIGAKRIREARSARKKAALRGGCNNGNDKKQLKKSNTGSGVLFSQVIRLKYVKGFTQAVRNPCRLDDL